MTFLLVIFVLPFVVMLMASGGGSSSPTSTETGSAPTATEQKQADEWEIGDEILTEQKARTEAVHAEVANLVKQGRYQEAKNTLLRRQEEIIATMAVIKQNGSLSPSNKERILEPMAVEAAGIAEEVKIIGEADIDELLRSIE